MEDNKLMKIFPLLLQNEDDENTLKMTPTDFLKEMRLSTTDRIEKFLHYKRSFLAETINKAFPCVFKPSLPIVIFQNFTPEKVYNVSITLLNSDKIARSVTMTCEKSPYFSVCYNSQAIIKVAPGMSEKFTIKFSPMEKRDYNHKVTFMSEDGSFDIPLFAIGPRPLLDFPDDIHFVKCPVKVPVTKVLCIFNVGEVDAAFILKTRSPFEVQPRKCLIKSGENLQVSVIFDSSTAGSFEELIEITYESGERLYCKVDATAVNSVIMLNSERINFEDTYAGLSRQKEISIHNHSSHVVNYRWMNYPNQKADYEVEKRMNSYFHKLHSKDKHKAMEEIAKETIPLETDKKPLSVFYCSEFLHDLSDNEFLFNHPNFSIEPMKGEIWPGSSINVQVNFMPDVGPKIYDSLAFCETSGCEKRHSLQLHGAGLGPKIELAPQVLDIGSVFARMKNSYEIVVANKGDIPGEIKYISMPLVFGGFMKCKPKHYKIEPGEHKAFVISYTAVERGDFIEYLIFQISESNETRKLTFKGHVNYGILEIDRKMINFGKLPIGFPFTAVIAIHNPSLLPISFNAYIAGKGINEQYFSAINDSINSQIINQVTVEPQVGFVGPKQTMNATVKVIPHIPKEYSFQLVVEMWDALTKPSTIPIVYEPAVPEIEYTPTEFYLSVCFINYPYNKKVHLTNTTEYPARFVVLPLELTEDESITAYTDVKEGIINASMTVSVPVSVMVLKVGKFSSMIRIKVFGLENNLKIKIIGEGQGPIVTAEIKNLDWEKKPVCTRESKDFQLVNHSPIPAEFSCELLKSSSPWSVHPQKGIIAPNDEVIISVEVNLLDDGRFSDILKILVRNSKILSVALSAVGYGTSITTDPPITPFLDLGNIFCSSTIKKEIIFKNNGTKVTTILFASNKKKIGVGSDVSLVFDFSPRKLVLVPGQHYSIFVEANHKGIGEVTESFWFWKTDNEESKRQRILEGFVKASFIKFHLNFSTRNLNFLSYKKSIVKETLTLSNDTSLQIYSVVTTEHPFMIVNGGKLLTSMEIDLASQEIVEITIEFDPSFLKESRSRTFQRVLLFTFKNLPHVCKVELIGEVKFPHVCFNVKEVDFGCVYAVNTMEKIIELTNDSPFPVKFDWKWNETFVTISNASIPGKAPIEVNDPNVELCEFPKDMFDALVRYIEKENENYINLMCFPELAYQLKEEEDIIKFLTMSVSENKTSLPISWVFDVMPNYGELEPYSSMEVTIFFRGYLSLEASGNLFCQVIGGVSEPIHISGKRSTISYSLDKTYINFKERVFCQMCYDKITITNTGPTEFHFKSNSNILDNMSSTQNFQPCSLMLEPNSGNIPGNSRVVLKVYFYPGKLGPLKSGCVLEILGVEPIHINIEAYGVFPQVFMYLPKDLSTNNILQLTSDLEYGGIANIKEDWMITEVLYPIAWDMYANYDPVAFDEIDWVLVLYEDKIPTVSDICLAIERQIAAQCISGNSDFSHFDEKHSFSDFIVPPYLLDMGYVLIGETATATVLLENCGAIPVGIHLLKESKEKLAKAGLKVSISNGHDLPVRQMAAIYVTIFPTKEIYTHQHHDIDIVMFFYVTYGARIPIRLLAEATAPFVAIEEENLNFGKVKCGQCKILSFSLTNPGWIDCIWEVNVLLLTKKPLIKKSESIAIDLKFEETIAPFSILPLKGKLSPGERRTMKVFFEPPHDGVFKGQMIIKIDKNPSDVIVKLKGTGLDPILKFNQSEVLFSPLIPGIHKSEKFILINNPNKYPVEIFLPAYDRQIIEEELILRLLLHYYEAEDLMIPALGVGAQLPKDYKDFYHWIIDEINGEFQKQNPITTEVEKATKVSKRAKSVTSKTKKSSSSSAFDDKTHTENNEDVIDKEKLASREMAMNSYLSGGIKVPVIENKRKDPMKSVMDRLTGLSGDGSLNSKNSFTSLGTYRQAPLFIFHGAPFSDHVHVAHRTSGFLGIPVINLDDVLLKEVVLGNSQAGLELKKILLKKMNEFFAKLHELKDECSVYHPSESNNSTSNEQDDDAVEEFSNKLATYLFHSGNYAASSSMPLKMKATSMVPKVKSTKSFTKNKTKVSSNQSDKSISSVSHPKPILWLDLPHNLHFSSIPENLLEEILSIRIRQPDCRHGFVVPTLRSVFFQHLENVLRSLLKVALGAYGIECIFMHNSFQQYVNMLKDRKEFKEEREKLFRVQKIENSCKECHTNIIGNLLLDEKYNFLNEPDAYLMKIKEKIQQMRKFSKTLEFAEFEVAKGFSTKKTQKHKAKKRSSGESIAGYMMKKSKANRPSTGQTSVNEGIKSSKKGLTETKGKIGRTVSPRKSQSKHGKSDDSFKLESHLPFSETVLSLADLEVEMALDLWNQFDNYNNILKKLLSLLESWPRRASEKLHNMSDQKIKSVKLNINSSAVIPENFIPSKDFGKCHSKHSDTPAIPVTIVNSPNIESMLVKSFFDVFVIPRASSLFSDHKEVSENKSINNDTVKLPDMTYLYIKKSWFNRMRETVDSVFTIKSMDSSAETSISLDMQEIIQEVESTRTLELSSFDNEKDEPTAIEENGNNLDEGKSGKLAKKKIKRSSLKLSKEKKKLPEKIIEARHVLHPGETVAYSVGYHPLEKGAHVSYLTVELKDWQRSYPIKICGICDIPALDSNPSSIFSKCAQEKPKSPTALYTPTYFHDIEALDFGLLLVDKKLDEQYTSVISKLTFHNISQVTVKANFTLERSNVNNFSIDKEELEIKTKEKGIIFVKASPKYPLRVEETLVCTMNSTDEIHLKLMCIGYKPEVELEPKQLNFDRVLLYRKEKCSLTLKNKCATSFFWHISSKDFIEGDDFNAVPVDGFLPCFASVPIEVEFIASKVHVIFKKPLNIELFYEKQDVQPLTSETALVSAESYDVQIDIHFAYFGNTSAKIIDLEKSDQPNHLNFGLMRAATQKKMLISLGNVGKYDVNFEVIRNEEYSNKGFGSQLDSIFKINPTSGTLKHGNKLHTIVEVESFPMVEVDMNNIPLYICRVIDTNVPCSKESTVANIPIHVSLTSAYSKFSIFPFPELNFGAIKKYSEKTLTFNICNKGKFDFTFIISKSRCSDQMKGEMLLPLVKKETLRRGTVVIESGCFTISPCMGKISVDELVTVTVHCFPELEGTLKEVIDITISDTPSGSRAKLTLSVTSCLPSVNFSNPEKMFIEHIICEDFSVFKWPSKLTNYTVYGKKDNELAFKGNFVGSTVKARLCLQNTSLVYAKVKISIGPFPEEQKISFPYHNKGSSTNRISFNCFSVKPKKVKIPPCSDKWVIISFTPALIEVYCALLAINIDEEDDESHEEDLESKEDTVTDSEKSWGKEVEEMKDKEQDEIKEEISKRNEEKNESIEEVVKKKEEIEQDKACKIEKYVIQPPLNEKDYEDVEEETGEEYEEVEETEFEDDEEEEEGEGGEAEEEKKEDDVINENSSSWVCMLSGEGLLPELTLTYPPELTKGPNGKYSFIIPPRYVGTIEKLKFSFQNTGYINCEVLIEFNGDAEYFKIFPLEKKTAKLMRKLKVNEPLESKSRIILKPMEEARFCFNFYAKSPGVFIEDICITPIGNPFGSIIIAVDAEITEDDIVIEGLDYVKKQFYLLTDPTDNSIASNNIKLSISSSNLDDIDHHQLSSELNLPKISKSSSQKETTTPSNDMSDQTPDSDHNAKIESRNESSKSFAEAIHTDSHKEVFTGNLLDFKNFNIGKSKIKKFWLVNHSKTSYVYKWIGVRLVPQLVLSPIKGVLWALSNVHISAVFTSSEPVNITQGLLKCHLKRVILEKESYAGDDSDASKSLDESYEEVQTSSENNEIPVVEEENIVSLIELMLMDIINREIFFGERNTENDEMTKSISQKNIDKEHEELKVETENEAQVSKEIFKVASEDIEEDGEKNELVFPIMVRAVVDYASYSCDLGPQVTFKTAVGLPKSYSFTLLNVGKVPFKFYWKFKPPSRVSENKSKGGIGPIRNGRNKQKKNFLILWTTKATMKVKAFRGKSSKKYFAAKCRTRYNPFSVVPEKGKLPPNGSLNICKIIFLPVRCGNYKAKLICSINNLAPGQCGPNIVVKGKAKQYLQYHFDCGKSNYRGWKEVPLQVKKIQPFSPDVTFGRKAEIIEIYATGVGDIYHKTLNFYNFTNKRSLFSWKNKDHQDGGMLEWTCCKSAGVIHPKSRTPMTFAFQPSKIGIYESWWSFSLVKGGKKTKSSCFHFVGIVSEPAVYFLKRCINMQPCYSDLTSTNYTYLINDEEIPLRFRIVKDTCSFGNKNGDLVIIPMKDVVKPKSDTLIRIAYTPKHTGKACFHVKFVIERRPSPLYLTVNCVCHEILPEVSLQIPSNSAKTTLKSTEPNDINFGVIRERTSYQGVFEIHNKGNCSFFYSWHYNEVLAKKIGLALCFSHGDGNLHPASMVTCTLTLSVLQKSRIENFKLALKITNGPFYIIYLSMVAGKPRCIFSFNSYNFGKCLVPSTGVHNDFKEVILIIKGKDKRPMMLECKFCNTNYMTVCLEKTVLLYNEEVKVPIRFFPREIVKYKEEIPFIMNEKWERTVIITGEGVRLKLELVNPKNKYINFKSVRVGSRALKIIPVVNKTSKPLDVYFRFSKERSNQEDECKCESFHNKPLYGNFLQIFPESEFTLKQGDVVDLHVAFSPSVEITNFSEKLVAVVKGFPEEVSLAMVHGCSEKMDICLTSSCLQFGPVVKDTTAVSYITLANKGVKATVYKWDPEEKLNPQFSISPTSGLCCPGHIVSFRVTFTPAIIGKCVECKIICHLKGHKNIILHLSGKGVNLPPMKDTLNFSAPVREVESKSVLIPNRSDEIVEVRPFLKGDYFQGANVLIIQPSSESMYQITYAPMTLSKGNKEHTGILYMHFPTGEEYSWNLVGIANPPLACSQINRKVQCRIPHTEILTVQNWLPITQRFHVTTELIPGKYGEPNFLITGYVKMCQPDSTRRNSTERRGNIKTAESKNKKSKLTGKELEKDQSMCSSISQKSCRIGGGGEPGGYLHVPANGFSQYKIKFICFEECSIDFKVIFTNEDTGEYLFQEINFTVTDYQTPQLIEINTKVRREIVKTFDIENPLPSIPLTFSLKSKLKFISFPESVTVAPNSTVTVPLRCFPLEEGYFSEHLFVSCPELGMFLYELKVNVKPIHISEYKEFQFTATLGSSESLTTPILIPNYTDKPADFICEVDFPAFLVQKCITVSPRDVKELDITFEPTALGNVCATLTCASRAAGSFSFKLKGTCIPPKAQGPFNVLANSKSVSIVFKNIFAKATHFTFKVTDPFALKSYSKLLQPKEETIITVSFSATGNVLAQSPRPVMGSLIVSLTEEVPCVTKWEYYLKGLLK